MNYFLNRASVLLVLFCTSQVSHALVESFPCTYLVVKNNCWKDYDLQVHLIDATNLKKKKSLNIKSGKMYGEVKFPCRVNDAIRFKASFTPAIWESDKDKQYLSSRIWRVPAGLREGADKWQILLCFPRDFQGVPIPLGQLRDCTCELSQFVQTEAEVKAVEKAIKKQKAKKKKMLQKRKKNKKKKKDK